jgi:AhpD family alkylhydroperoxidase
MKTLATLALTIFGLFHVAPASADPAADAKATYQDIEKTLGLVPGFMKALPGEEVAGMWDEIKSIELNPKSALPAKTKELIALAVASQIPCKYCIYFHTQVSSLVGATETEQREAVAMAGLTRHWSAVAQGLQIDMTEFKQELGRAGEYLKKGGGKGDGPAVVDTASAYKDIEHTLGLVPTFMRRFPEAGIVGAWKAFKSLELNPTTALPGKTKELIGLAVAAQIPCQYCVTFHTAAAQLNGATDAEIREAIAMAAITRELSAVANGAQLDEAVFRREVDQVVANAKRAAKK